MCAAINPSLANQLRAEDDEGKVEKLFAYMREHGQGSYDEAVTQLDHGLQAARLARQSGVTSRLVTAALLHDLGHFLLNEETEGERLLADDFDHEHVAADYLAPFFPTAVTEPIRLHVPAKRYLCTTDPSYYDGLSQASKRSFVVQGGHLNAEERAELNAHPHLQKALHLRRWDDQSKVADLTVPRLEAYREDVLRALRSTT